MCRCCAAAAPVLKAVPQCTHAMAKYSHVTSVEATLMKKIHEQGMGLRKIRKVTGRPFETIPKHVFKKIRPTSCAL